MRHLLLSPAVLVLAGISLGLAGVASAGQPMAAAGKSVQTASEPRNYFPFLMGSYTFGGQWSENLVSGYFDSITPLWAPGTVMLILNTRTTYDDNDELDSSYGLVARYRLPDRDVIIGANAYYDSIDSQFDNSFNSLGFGAEFLTKWVDARFNYYLPENDRFVVSSSSSRSRNTVTSAPFVNGNAIQQTTTTRTRTTSSSTYEAALKGWNAEVGFLIPGLDQYLETRLFGGYYRYHNPFGDDFEGFKGRLEAHFLPGVMGDVEYWDDTYLTGGHWTAGVRVTVPFSFYNLFTGANPFEGAGESFRPRQREFKERMTDLVIRSHRVKTVKSKSIQTGDATSTNTATAQVGTVPTSAPPVEIPEDPR